MPFGFTYYFPSDHLSTFFYFKEQTGFILKLAQMRECGRQIVAQGVARSAEPWVGANIDLKAHEVGDRKWVDDNQGPPPTSWAWLMIRHLPRVALGAAPRSTPG